MSDDQNKEAKDVAHKHSLLLCDYCDNSLYLDPMSLLGTLDSYIQMNPSTRPFLIKDGVKIIL